MRVDNVKILHHFSEDLSLIAILTLFIIIFMSLLVMRIATMALMLTGLSRESARFQARSAYTGVGFTTTESESIAGHPRL